ncbi:hypothetical protein FKX85_05835 [Echinicola soli]|uniref:Uncharacterized protein n=2 Tax=Echinicola soli TaxID=2591634 RepID=A0A514CP42_9BACT|nr:hypothetical protein FKX85_05835 [Echinicola soli]
MEITVLEKTKTDKIPSGSGIVKSGDVYHIIGDDSPFLFSLNSDFQIISKTPLVDSLHSAGGRIPKSEKPDFEALEMIGQNEMVAFGSGSKSPQRDIFIRALLKDSLLIEKYQITDFYNKLRKLPILHDAELNIEAAAFHNKRIYLFNRKKNLVLQFEYTRLLNYLRGEASFPQPEITAFSLPKINGIEAGFSGAASLKGEAKIIFTASVEDTDNAYNDGEILGSFIGMIDISDNKISESFDYCKIPNEGEHLKVESISVEKEISPGRTEVVLITDDDKGNSVLLKGRLRW